MPAGDPGGLALQHIDKALAEKPEKNGHELSGAIRCLGEFRDLFIAAHRGAPDDRYRRVLEIVNAIISSVLSVQYPLGEIQWIELVTARESLAVVVNSGLVPQPA